MSRARDLANIADQNISGPVVIEDDSANDALRITQTGSGNALVVEDDNGNPDSTPFVINAQGRIMIGQTTTTGAKVVIGGFTDNTFASSTGIGVFGNSHFENGLKIGSLDGGTIGSDVVFPAGHILQCLNATVTNVDNTATTSNYVADVISQITIKSGNYVKLTVFLNFKINSSTVNAVGSVRIHKGTVASPSTLLLATDTIGDYQNTSGINLPVTLSVIDESPASTTPSYCFRINRDSAGTTSVQIIGTPIVILEEINV